MNYTPPDVRKLLRWDRHPRRSPWTTDRDQWSVQRAELKHGFESYISRTDEFLVGMRLRAMIPKVVVINIGITQAPVAAFSYVLDIPLYFDVNSKNALMTCVIDVRWPLFNKNGLVKTGQLISRAAHPSIPVFGPEWHAFHLCHWAMACFQINLLHVW
jgi:hypothetical protein